MKVFLTGASGFIGSHTARSLIEAGDQVVALSRSGKLNPLIEDLIGEKLQVLQGDLLDAKSYEDALADCDAIVHIAGWISTARKDKEKLKKLNFDTTQTLWQTARNKSLSKIVYLASIFAHGWANDGELCNEDTPYDPAIFELPMPYFKIKRKAELFTEDCIAEGMPIVRGYPGYCIGPGDYTMSSMRAVEQYLKGNAPAIVDGGMSFIDVRDAAAGLTACLHRGQVGEKYLLTGHNMLWSEFFELVSEVYGKKKFQISLPYSLTKFSANVLETFWSSSPFTEGDVALLGQKWFFDCSRARAKLNMPLRDLKESLRDGIEWMQANSYI